MDNTEGVIPQASLPFEDSIIGSPVLSAALPALPDHFDELRESPGRLRAYWQQFFDHMAAEGLQSLDQRSQALERQIRDNGITYNVYADASGAQRPWSLDALPFIIDEADWQVLAAGVAQRARMMNAILQDVYGPQQLLAEGLLPPALVFGHPGYLRPLKGYVPPGGTHLHIAAFDLTRTPQGGWAIVSRRTEAPSGLGYALENRLVVSRLFPEAFRQMRVQRLAPTYRLLTNSLRSVAPARNDPRIVLLTPGPYNETYFEQSFLARYLGIPLVEGSDLTVRDDRVYLKTLAGLDRVDVILRRLDDDYCDPVELRADSTIGIPGLLQAMRAGNVVLANAPGSGFLETPAINGFLPAVSERLRGEKLLLPSWPTWWCGEAAALEDALPELSRHVIHSTYPRLGFTPVTCNTLSADALAAWRTKIIARPADYTLQAATPLSQTPTWVDGNIVPRAAVLRVFAIADGQGGYSVMPGGLTRTAAPNEQTVSMQRGGSSVDTWVLTSGSVGSASLLPGKLSPGELAVKHRMVSSRSAENLFWLGRYSERAENNVRLCRLLLGSLGSSGLLGDDFLISLGELAVRCGLVPENTPSPKDSIRIFERTLAASLAEDSEITSVGQNLAGMNGAASQVRDRLATDHWRMILAARTDFARELSVHADTKDNEYKRLDVQAALDHLALQLSAISGAQSDRMTRDDAWRLQLIGRHLERLDTVCMFLGTLAEGDALLTQPGFELLLDLFDSTLTYRSLYPGRLELPALLDLLVMEELNPRAPACILASLRTELVKLPVAQSARLQPTAALHDSQPPLASFLPAPDLNFGVGMSLEELCLAASDGSYKNLQSLCNGLRQASSDLSDEIGRRYFSHADRNFTTVAA